MRACINHVFRERRPGNKCIACGIYFEAIQKAKELELKALRWDEPQRKKKRLPRESRTDWRSAYGASLNHFVEDKKDE